MKILSKKLQGTISTIISSVILSILCGILVLYTITFLSSCSSDIPTPKPIEPIETENPQPITFSTNLKQFLQTYSTTGDVTVGSEAYVFVGNDIANKKVYVSNTINELEAKTTQDELFASSTPQTLNVFYPSNLIYNIQATIEVNVSNSQAEVTKNRDLVYCSVDVVRQPNTPFSKTELSFKHLFSILRIKLIQGTTDDNIGDMTLKYNASNSAFINYDGSIGGIGSKTDHYFFESNRKMSGSNIKSIEYDAVVLPVTFSSTDGVLTLNGTQYKLMDLFAAKFEQGKIYTIEVTVNKKNISFGSITVASWTDGSISTIILEK